MEPVERHRRLGAQGYRVYDGGTLVASTGAASFAHVGLTAASMHTYTVSAYDNAENVDASAPAANFGTAAKLRVDGSPVVRSYLRFDVPALGAPVASAKLRVYALTSLASSALEARAVPGLSWNEATITYASAPAPAPLPTAVVSPVRAGRWLELGP